MSTRFAGKTVVVSGASSGLGRCLSLQLAAEGAKLILFARRQQKLHETARACLEQTPPAQSGVVPEPSVIVGDITQPEDCQRLVQEAKRCGGLDYLLNCAGISMWMRFVKMQNLDALEQLMHTNYLGVARLIHGLLPLLQRRQGLICAISSLQGLLPIPYHSGYAASKHALEGFLNSLRLEQPGVHILVVYPYWLEGTELRSNAIGQPPPNVQSNDKASVSAEACAHRILNSMHRRHHRITVPASYRFLPLLYALYPALLERIIQRRVRRQLPRSYFDQV